MVDQVAINAGFDFRRYAVKPTPAKPRIIMAHVEGSGTAEVAAKTPGLKANSPPKSDENMGSIIALTCTPVGRGAIGQERCRGR